MLKGLFATLAGAASLAVLQTGPDGATGSLEARREAASAPSQVSGPARDGGLGVWIPRPKADLCSPKQEWPGNCVEPLKRSFLREEVVMNWKPAFDRASSAPWSRVIRALSVGSKLAHGHGD
jgi:hypothetical protein